MSDSTVGREMPRRRKVEFPFHYAPEGRYVQVVARLSDEPGALASLLGLLGGRLNLVGTQSYSIEDGSAMFSGYGKILDDSSAHDIEELSSLSHSVQACRVWESNNGLLVDRFHIGLQTASGEAFLMLPVTALASTFEELVRTFGSGGETILYSQGMDYAKVRWNVYKKILGPHPETRIDDLAAIFGSLGWGITTVRFESGKLKYVTRDCFECSVKTSYSRRCSFLRGMAVGIGQNVFGEELICEETRCRQKGGDVCEFVLSAKDGTPLG
jgi:predicted hydrocarbon binding protein